jgi:uncharacterized membrane protein YoaK (UPF0700 family)
MKWVSLYLVGFIIFMVGVFWALSAAGVLDDIGPTWTMISVLIALGIGVMIAVSSSGRKENITIDSK